MPLIPSLLTRVHPRAGVTLARSMTILSVPEYWQLPPLLLGFGCGVGSGPGRSGPGIEGPDERQALRITKDMQGNFENLLSLSQKRQASVKHALGCSLVRMSGRQ